MGKFQSGILGSFQGNIGPVVGARWKGIYYMRSRRRKSTKPFSPAQLNAHAKFTLVTKFVHRLGKLFMQSFQATPGMTGINISFRNVFENAITGAYPLYELDYSRIKISSGDLPLPTLPTAAANSTGGIVYNWEDNSSQNNFADASDKAVLVLYCDENKQAIFIHGPALRSDGTALLDAEQFTGKKVQTWLTFVSKTGTDYATSIFTGELAVT